MSLVAFAPFAGLVPRSDPLSLPTGAAQVAQHCRLTSGGILEAYKRPLTVFQPATNNIQTIYRFGQTTNSDTDFWFTSSNVVNYVKGAIAGDSEERTYYTGDGFPKVTDSSLATQSLPYPSNHFRLGLPAVAEAPMVSVSGAFEQTALTESRYYIQTFVSSKGEESPPCEPSSEVTIRPGQVATVMMTSPPSGPYDVSTRRLYRTASGSNSTEFLFVVELPAAQAAYDDSTLAEDLGEPCPTITYAQLPDLARGLTAMANGIMAAHTEYDVYFCEPFKPYAWPEGYIQTVGYPVVALGSFGQSLVVLTKGNPVIMSGTSPESISVETLSVPYACMSPRSVVSALNSVIYAAPDGLVSISNNGPVVLTEALFTRREWNALNPASMVCAVWDEKIFIFYDNGVARGGLILDTQNGLTTTDVCATAAFTDPVTNSLFLAVDDKIVKWDAGEVGTFTWRSRKLNMPTPRNFAYGQVLADTYPITANVYADGVLKCTKLVVDDKPFRLPGGFRARYWEFELSGSGKAFMAYLADSAQELQSV